jgi:hypothetical protein
MKNEHGTELPLWKKAITHQASRNRTDNSSLGNGRYRDLLTVTQLILHLIQERSRLLPEKVQKGDLYSSLVVRDIDIVTEWRTFI